VDDDWIARRLERWGKRDGMPFLGPNKAAILQQLVAQQQPQLAVEVGTMAGYSAIKIAQVIVWLAASTCSGGRHHGWLQRHQNRSSDCLVLLPAHATLQHGLCWARTCICDAANTCSSSSTAMLGTHLYLLCC
jgi:hypothetical protein